MPLYVPLLPVPIQLQDSSGSNLSGGTLEFFEAGTTTPTNLYSDNAGTSIGDSITLNASGYPESGSNVITLFRDTDVDLKIVAKNASGATVWTADGLSDALSALGVTSNGNGASLIGIEDADGNFTATNVEDALTEIADNYLTEVADDTSPELGGHLACADKEIQRAEIKDYAVSHSAPTISSGALSLDCETANSFKVTLTENITSITLSNPPASGKYGQVNIVFVQDGTGSWTVSGWPSSVKWPSGTAPTITTTATTGTDLISLQTSDGGTTWLGNYAQDYS